MKHISLLGPSIALALFILIETGGPSTAQEATGQYADINGMHMYY
jgi:hypothetical protein